MSRALAEKATALAGELADTLFEGLPAPLPR
jgi:hypothetical protein